MNAKLIQFFAFSFIALLLGSFAFSSNAQAVVYVSVISDDYMDSDRMRICGKPEETSNACIDQYRDCLDGLTQITKNLFQVCEQRPEEECSWKSEGNTYLLSRELADVLYHIPVNVYSKRGDISDLNNCRVEHPKSEDPPRGVEIDPELEAQRREEARRKERGEAPLDNVLPVAENAPAAPVGGVGADAAQNGTEANTGGCSLQAVNSPATALNGLFAMLVAVIPFATSALGGGRKKK